MGASQLHNWVAIRDAEIRAQVQVSQHTTVVCQHSNQRGHIDISHIASGPIKRVELHQRQATQIDRTCETVLHGIGHGSVVQTHTHHAACAGRRKAPTTLTIGVRTDNSSQPIDAGISHLGVALQQDIADRAVALQCLNQTIDVVVRDVFARPIQARAERVVCHSIDLGLQCTCAQRGLDQYH